MLLAVLLLASAASAAPVSDDCAQAARLAPLREACSGTFSLERLLAEPAFAEAADVLVSPVVVLRDALCRAGASRSDEPCRALEPLTRDYHHNDEWYPTARSCRVGRARLALHEALLERKGREADRLCRELVLADVRVPAPKAAERLCAGISKAEGREAAHCAGAAKALEALSVTRKQCEADVRAWFGRARACPPEGRVDQLDEDYCRLTSALRAARDGDASACEKNPACRAFRGRAPEECAPYGEELGKAFCSSLARLEDPAWLERARREPDAGYVQTGPHHRVRAQPLAEALAAARRCKSSR